MEAIVESYRVRAKLTRYEVPGWGAGELWTSGDVVLAHDFDFTPVSDTDDAFVAVSAERASLETDEGLRPSELVERFAAFLAGADTAFGDIPLDLGSFTPFQRAVADALRLVPSGEVVTYGELAALAGYPGAQRAVGTFCARNRFMLLIPCHRVVASDGIGSYGSAGPEVKRRLLALEGVSV